jgi:hypothetical protein
MVTDPTVLKEFPELKRFTKKKLKYNKRKKINPSETKT